MTQSIRNEVDAILRKWGWDIYLQKRINKTADCVQYKNEVERHTVRASMPGGTAGLPTTAQEEEGGVEHDADMLFYFRWSANPAEGDRIYDQIERVPEETIRYIIDYAVPMRGVGGTIDFWSVGATREKD